MFRHRASEKLDVKTIIDWFLLVFLAGSVNAGGFLACNRFVSHVTGFATLAGVDAAAGNWAEAFGILSVPMFFLLGVVISAYHVERRISEGKAPAYGRVMAFVTLCLFLAGLGGVLGWWSDFGQNVELSRDYFFLALLCMASGLQNAALTSSSGSTLRITHLTGATTDLGIGFMRWATHQEGSAEREQELRSNTLRIATIFSFMFGSGVGSILFLKFHYWGFSLPILIALYATLTAANVIPNDLPRLHRRH